MDSRAIYVFFYVFFLQIQGWILSCFFFLTFSRISQICNPFFEYYRYVQVTITDSQLDFSELKNRLFLQEEGETNQNLGGGGAETTRRVPDNRRR
jgi:hypothetical protein